MARRARSLSVWAAFLLVGVFVATAGAQTQALPRPSDDRTAQVDEALRLSHLRTNLASIRGRLADALDADRSNPEIQQWVAGSLKAAYAPDAYLRAIREALLARYDADAISRVRSWYRSPAGRKIARLEEATLEPGQGAAKKKYLAGLEDKQPSDYRLVLIFSIDEAAHTSAGAAAAITSTIRGLGQGIEQLGSGRERQDVRQLEDTLRKYGTDSRDDVADDVLRDLMYAYREATDAALRAYAEFLESDVGRWFIGTVARAHQAYFEGAVEQIAQDFVDAATRKPAPRPVSDSRPRERDTPPTLPGRAPPTRR